MQALVLPDKSRLACGDTGSGAPLVLVHGSPAEGRAWGRVAKHLAPGFRVLTPDLPGYGASDPLPPGANGTAALAAAVGALIASLDAPAWVVGHSYGGNVALHAAIAQQQRVRGLVLFEPVFFWGLALAGEDTALAGARVHFEDYVRRVEDGDSPAVFRMIDFWFGTGAFAKLPPPVRAFLVKFAPKNAADVKASFAESLPQTALAGFDRPTIIAYGGASPPIIPTIAHSLARLLPRAEARAIPGGTHAMLDTHAEAVAALINEHARA